MPVRPEYVALGGGRYAEAWAIDMEAYCSTEKKDTITVEEHRGIIRRLNEKDRLLACVLFDSGCLVGEICRAIRPEHIQEDLRSIWVKNRTNACSRRRPAPLGIGTLSLLNNYIERKNLQSFDHIFPTSWNVFSKALKMAVEKCGLDDSRNINVSTYQHSKVQRLREAKVPGWLINLIIGRSQPPEAIDWSPALLKLIVEDGHQDLKW